MPLLCALRIDESDTVLGWIAGESSYHGNVWELHPLAVLESQRRRGIGRRLVLDFEEYVQTGADRRIDANLHRHLCTRQLFSRLK